MMTMQQIKERLDRIELAVNALLQRELGKTDTKGLEAMTAELNYWRQWAYDNGWAKP